VVKVEDHIIQVTQFKLKFILSTKNLGFILQNDIEIKANIDIIVFKLDG